MSVTVVNPKDIRKPAGPYSHGLVVEPGKRWLFTTGQVAITLEGEIPEGAEAQSLLVWQHLKALLVEAQMEVTNIVKTTVHVTSAETMAIHNKVRNTILGSHCPVTTATIVSALANPRYLVEVDIVACL